MKVPGPATFQPEQYRRHFTPKQIREHLEEVLEIVEQLDPPMDLRASVFGVAQAMCSSMESKDAATAQARAALGLADGLGVRG
jgi:hypothetical protein